jgi:hypothetical protein
MHGSSRVPAARENEKADEKIEQADDAQIIFNGGRPLGRLSYQKSFKLPAAALDSVVGLRPQSDAPQAFGYINGAMDWQVINGQNFVSSPDTGYGCG